LFWCLRKIVSNSLKSFLKLIFVGYWLRYTGSFFLKRFMCLMCL
jgi:hypothetical protein